MKQFPHPNEKIAELLVESIVDYAIYFVDLAECVRSWNPGAERLKGYTAQEIVGSNIRVFYTAADIAADVPTRSFELARASGRFAGEGWRVRKDGTTFWASVVIDAVRDDAGTLIGFAKITRDLSAVRAAQEEREQLLARLRVATEAGQVGIFHIDVNADTIDANPTAYELFGFGTSADRPQLATWVSCIDPADRQLVAREIVSAAVEAASRSTSASSSRAPTRAIYARSASPRRIPRPRRRASSGPSGISVRFNGSRHGSNRKRSYSSSSIPR